MNRFVIVFLGLLAVLFVVELLDPVQQSVIQPFTGWLADVSAALLAVFDGQVRSAGKVISHAGNGFAVSIEAGCNGVEAAIVLISGVVAFPAGWKQKAAAIVFGFLAIQAMNILRIVSLFYLGQWNIELFRYTHLYLWPVLIMLDVLVVFICFMRWVQRTG
ncbi:MAG: exosortase H [Pseudomonadota bacterium]